MTKGYYLPSSAQIDLQGGQNMNNSIMRENLNPSSYEISLNYSHFQVNILP